MTILETQRVLSGMTRHFNPRGRRITIGQGLHAATLYSFSLPLTKWQQARNDAMVARSRDCSQLKLPI